MDASYIKYGIQETSDRMSDVELGEELHLPVQEQTRSEDEIDLGGEAFWHSQPRTPAMSIRQCSGDGRQRSANRKVIQNNETTDGALNTQTNSNYSVQEIGDRISDVQLEHGPVQEEAGSEDIAQVLQIRLTGRQEEARSEDIAQVLQIRFPNRPEPRQ
ncbi:unnamed protein product [Lymnaea stagnalis]|uniref:Uncharacterized protein n=1 Tax=Lymnaea stagnalis TaxID=6523 RepID=A0AAV2HJH9_LYMST